MLERVGEKGTLMLLMGMCIDTAATENIAEVPCCAVLRCLIDSEFLQPQGLQPPRLSPWGLSRQEYWSGLKNEK